MTISLGHPINRSHPLMRGIETFHSTILGQPFSLGSTWFDLNRKVDSAVMASSIWDGSYGRPGGRGSASMAPGVYSDITTIPSTWSNGLTIAAWIRPSTTGRQDYFGRWTGSGYSFVLLSGIGTGYSFYTYGGGSFPNATTGVAISAGTWSRVVGTYDNANIRIYLDGALMATTADAAGINAVSTAAYIGQSGDSSSTCQMDDCILLSRPWSADEVYQDYTLSRQGWGSVLNRIRPVTYFGPAAGGANYTLIADQTSFTLTGQAATLKADRKLTAVQASFTLTGQAANLLKGFKLTADQASFTLTGQTANLLFGRVVIAAHGSFTLTGQSANLLKGSRLTAAQGTFTLTGQDAGLKASRLLTASHTTYTLTGNAAGLYKGRTLTASHGTFTLSGQAATFGRTYVLACQYVSFVLTGQSATLTYSAAEPEEPDPYTINYLTPEDSQTLNSMSAQDNSGYTLQAISAEDSVGFVELERGPTPG